MFQRRRWEDIKNPMARFAVRMVSLAGAVIVIALLCVLIVAISVSDKIRGETEL